MTSIPIESKRFRDVLGHHPTGVAVVTGRSADGKPAGLAVGSFTSVSLDPPLVAFLVDQSSSSWPKIRDGGVFCVNVLSAEQEHVCRKFASKADDKFAGVPWRDAGSGSPLLEGAVAWIDCDLYAVHEAGDHSIVIGHVRELDAPNPSSPLLFFRGGYGSFAPGSLAAQGDDLLEPLRVVDLARREMEAAAADLGVECVASAPVGQELVLLATAGQQRTGGATTRVGQRLPFVPPIGSVFVAWGGDAEIDRWLARLGPQASADDLDGYRRVLEAVRHRGYSLGLGDATHGRLEETLARLSIDPRAPDLRAGVRRLVGELGGAGYQPAELTERGLYEVRSIVAPVFGPMGQVALALSLYGLAHPIDLVQIETYAGRLRRAAAAVSEVIGGSGQ